MAGLDSSSSVIHFGHVQEAVVDRIRDMIVSGRLKPGDRLRQDELAATFGVSAMPIREALRQLQAEGLVTFEPRRGAAVSTLSVSEYEEIYLMREALEILAVRWAVEDFDRVPIDRMRQLLTEIEDAEAHEKILFHLYKQRRENATDPGVMGYYLQRMLDCSDENFEFHAWYLKSKGFIEITQEGKLAITIDGVDHVISMSRTAEAEKLLIAQAKTGTDEAA